MSKIDRHSIASAECLLNHALTLSQHTKIIENRPSLFHQIHNFFYRPIDQSIALGKSCIDFLDLIEKTPVIFSDDQNKTDAQNKCYETALKAAKTVISILNHSKSGKAQSQLHKLMRRVAALQYRIEVGNGGLNPSAIDRVLSEKLCKAAEQWKDHYDLIHNKQLSALDLKKLEEVSQYPEFANVLLVSKQLRESFFNWSLRDDNGIRQFIEFPSTCERMKSVFIATRIGKLGSDMLKLEKAVNEENGLIEKNVSLPFFINEKKEYVTILDETKTVVLNNEWHLTIHKIFKIFSEKNRVIGDLEFFDSTGIANWNCHELGSWNPKSLSYDKISLTEEHYWKKFPVLEEVTREKLESRTGITLVDGEWIVSAKATRTTPDLDLDARHGYLEVYIPTGKGTYALYPFGKFAVNFPNSIIDLIKFITNTLEARISYPDENHFYSHRQLATYPMKITEEQGAILMHTIQKDLIKARYKCLIFQFAAENCAFWAQSVLNSIDKKMPNFFRREFLESHPSNPALKVFFCFFRSVPKSMLNGAIRAVDTLLGSGRKIKVLESHKRIFKSHKLSPVRNEFVIYQPGSLHEQIEEGRVKGIISTGSC